MIKLITTDLDLFTAALSQTRVSVYQDADNGTISIVDYGGRIEKYTPFSVKINGNYFTRGANKFGITQLREGGE